MKKAVIDVPAMYGDHHVLRLRRALLEATGVSDVDASAAQRKVAVCFDEAATSLEAIHEVLSSAGYPPGEDPTVGGFPHRHEDGSPWHTIIDRKTTTERKDREMAGDHRRY
jgi:copper chaperone CopZ